MKCETENSIYLILLIISLAVNVFYVKYLDGWRIIFKRKNKDNWIMVDKKNIESSGTNLSEEN